MLISHAVRERPSELHKSSDVRILVMHSPRRHENPPERSGGIVVMRKEASAVRLDPATSLTMSGRG